MTECPLLYSVVEDSYVSEMFGEVLEIGTDSSAKPFVEVILVGDAGEEFLCDDDVSVGDGNGEGHDIIKIIGLDVALPVKVSTEDKVEVGIVSGELHKKVVERVEGGIAGDDGKDVDVDGELFGGMDEAGKHVVPEAFYEQLFAAFHVGVGNVLGLLSFRFEGLDILSANFFISEVGEIVNEVVGLDYLPGDLLRSEELVDLPFAIDRLAVGHDSGGTMGGHEAAAEHTVGRIDLRQ